MKHVDIVVEGCVQGVGFRWSARRQARQLNLAGFVRNVDDGSVHLEAEGAVDAVDQFVEWCRHGPPSAMVDRMTFREGAVRGWQGFEVRP